MKLNIPLGATAVGMLATSFGSTAAPISVNFNVALAHFDVDASTSQPVLNESLVENEGIEADGSTQLVLPAGAIDEWDEVAKAEFTALSKRFALRIITGGERSRYELLKDLRRREAPSRSFDQIRADIEFHRNVENAIQAIRRLMDHGEQPYFHET